MCAGIVNVLNEILPSSASNLIVVYQTIHVLLSWEGHCHFPCCDRECSGFCRLGSRCSSRKPPTYLALRDMALHVSLLLGQLLVGLLGIHGMQNDGASRYWEKWSDEEIAARKAEAWENSTWSTTPLSGWDPSPQAAQVLPASAGISSQQPAPSGHTTHGEPEATVTSCGHPSSSAWGPCYEDAARTFAHEQPSSFSSTSAVAATVEGEGVVPADLTATGGGDLTLGSGNTASTRWDEEISLAAQDNEILHFVDFSLAPIPEDLPLPFNYKCVNKTDDVQAQPGPEEQEGDTSSASSSSVDWWEEILDRRALRGRPAPPSCPGRPPATLATPKMQPGPAQAVQGISQRGGKLRHGIVDRWHYPNGSIRVRQRERLAAEAATSTQVTAGPMDSQQGDHATSPSVPCSSTPMQDPVSFYGRLQKNGSSFEDTSTAVGDMEPASSNSSSSSSPATTIGFWANGIWNPRARTPAEERSHRGGSGPKRTQRRQDRVQRYLAGEWRPAWLEGYIHDRKCREEMQEAESTQAVTEPDPSPTPSTDPDPWSGQWQDSWWNSWSWSSSWEGWQTPTWTSTSTTSPAAGQEIGFPNDGLMPEVRDVDPRELAEIVWTMQLTESERALLVDAGTPEAVVNRISDLFERLEDHDSLERGPEARWALGRLVRRMDEAIENQGVILQVMMRRLQIRGRWPVVRVPAQEMARWRLFAWIRQYGGIFAETHEHHLQVPLQPREDENMLEAPLSAQASAPSSNLGPAEPDPREDNHTVADEQVGVSPASSSSSTPSPRSRPRSRTPPPGFDVEATGLQRALQGEIMGIWREPPEDQEQQSAGLDGMYAGTPNTASTTTTSWGLQGGLSQVAGIASSTTSTTVNFTCTSSSSSTLTSSTITGVSSTVPAVLSSELLVDTVETLSSCSSPSCTSTWSWTWMWSTTSTSTSSSMPTAWPTDIVSEAVVQEMQLATEADAIDVAHRLLARTRLLVRNQRLLIVALEETLAWMQSPANAAPLNGATMDNHIWRTVAREAATSDDRPSTATSSTAFAPPAVLLQPGLPRTWSEVVQAVPGLSARAVVGLRRRVWRNHATEVLRRSSPGDTMTANRTANPLAPDDCELYLLQTDPGRAVEPNFGGALPTLPGRAGFQARRRHRVARVPPPLRDPAWATWTSSSPSSRTPAGTPERARERSRSRDVSRHDAQSDGHL